jgi:hypothetical protein
MNLDVSDIFYNPLLRKNFFQYLITPADTSHYILHEFCWLPEINFSIFSETKALMQELRQN